MTASDIKSPQLLQWVVDTRALWPQATKTADLPQAASAALEILPQSERAEVLKYVRVQDAKMSLASRLVKRYAIARFCDVAWAEATSFADASLKPVFRKRDGSEPLLFNVTHQDGLVILLGVHNPPSGCAVGVDVVSPPERSEHDHRSIKTDGWHAYVDTFAEVFGHGEVRTLKNLPFDAQTEDGRDSLLRYFYSLWCLREAFVKMTGEALLASWLRDLEMHGFAPPGDLAESDAAREAWRRQTKEPHVRIDLVDYKDRYMVASVVRDPGQRQDLRVGAWQEVDVAEILDFERRQR